MFSTYITQLQLKNSILYMPLVRQTGSYWILLHWFTAGHLEVKFELTRLPQYVYQSGDLLVV